MLESIIQSFHTYYGLDWLALIFGMLGMYLISEKVRWGFAFNFVACCAGFYVAFISLQFGYVFYNFVLVFLMVRGFQNWSPVCAVEKA